MVRYGVIRFISFIIFVLSIASCNPDAEACAVPKPSLYDLKKLNELRKKEVDDSTVVMFLNEAYRICNDKILTVIDKPYSFSNNPHDYCSLARYSWPDENNPKGPYITKDGKTNPEIKLFDRPKLEELANRLQKLSIAFYITRNHIYYDAFVKNIKTWFIDKDSYMEPNFVFAQVEKGHNNNKGQSYGLCEMDVFTPIIESVLLINVVKPIDNELMNNLIKWYSLFLEWLLDSSQWAAVSMTNNNIVASCYVSIVEMARFTGNKRLVKQISNTYTRIINTQISDDGRQLAELKRTIAFGYSVANLNNIVDFALIMEQSGGKFYKHNQRRIDSAFDYLLQFIDNHGAFPYKQEASWDYYENKLKLNYERLNRLTTKKRGAKTHQNNHKSDSIADVVKYVY